MSETRTLTARIYIPSIVKSIGADVGKEREYQIKKKAREIAIDALALGLIGIVDDVKTGDGDGATLVATFVVPGQP